MIRNISGLVLCILVFFVVSFFSPSVLSFAQTTPPPGCTNGDCSGPPSCSNGDCAPPGCTNGDCEPGDPGDCCCVGSNLPGTLRVCCCPNAGLDTLQCRLSQVLDTDDPEFHVTLSQETLEGSRPRSCDSLLQRFCSPPVEEVCKWKRGQRICETVVKRICLALDQVCQYRFCGPDWFPFDEPTPASESCGWWDQIRQCHR